MTIEKVMENLKGQGVTDDKLAEMIKEGALRGDSAKRIKNRKVTERLAMANEDITPFRESMKRRFNIDIFDDKAFPVKESSFNWKTLRNQLIEADSETSFVQFLRAGVQNITQSAYMAVDTTFEDWVTVVSSNKIEELYAPNQGVSFPRQVGPQTPYPEVGVAALDIKLRNRKYGSMYAVEQELLEDDQTGSFQQQAALMGEYLKLLVEVWVMGKLASVSNMQYIDLIIPVSETKPSNEANYPYSTNFVGGGRNRPDSYGLLTQPNLQAGIIGLMNQKNLQGIKMQVSPKRLIIGTQWVFDAAVLLNSSYYPSGASSAGVVGGAFAINPLGPTSPFRSIAQITSSRYMFKNDGTVNGDSKAWYICDDSKPFFIVQYRTPVAVTQENPQSGESFERDICRFKANTRMNADFIDPRFIWAGNDGSVT